MQKHVVYVPEKLEQEARYIALRGSGGVTLSPGHLGYWVDSQGTLIEDRITLVTVFEEKTEVRDEIVDLLFADGEQAVAYETNGVPNLVTEEQMRKYITTTSQKSSILTGKTSPCATIPSVSGA